MAKKHEKAANSDYCNTSLMDQSLMDIEIVCIKSQLLKFSKPWIGVMSKSKVRQTFWGN